MKNHIIIGAQLDRQPNGSYTVRVVMDNPAEAWDKLADFMEVVAALGNQLVGHNPKQIADQETMSQYCAEYIAKAMQDYTAP